MTHHAEAHDLAAAQGWLLERVTQPAAALDAALADDARWVVNGRWSSRERVTVYRRAYFARLVECLRDDYPAVAHALGASFEPLCLAFIHAHPPASASLNAYGAPFAHFLAASRLPQASFLSELARFEWAIVECIHADARRTLDARTLGALSERDWSRAGLVQSPAARVLSASFPVHEYHRAWLRGDEPAPPVREDCTIVVCRRAAEVWRFGVDARLSGLLWRLVQGEPLASALGALPTAGAPACAAAELQRAMSEWVARGLFSSVRVSETPPHGEGHRS